MLRVEVLDSANTLSFKLQGRLTGNDAESTRMLVTRFRVGMRLVVDLTDVTFIDSVGEEVLSFFARFNAEFVAQTSYTLDICERLSLRVTSDGASDTKLPGASRTNGRGRRAFARQLERNEL